jgi:hypothetical protein
MKKRIVAAITGGVWLAAIGSAVALTYALHRPLEVRQVGRSSPARGLDVPAARQVVEEEREERGAPSFLLMPAMVVRGDLQSETAPAPTPTRGAAEMQAPDEVVIGPGVVTYPPAARSKRNRDATPGLH